MKSFLEFLIEMSVTDAMKLFGINEVPSTKEELNKHFKKLALKHHPDLGGSEETMKMLNQAKELLDKNLGKSFKSSTVAGQKSEYDIKMEYVKSLIRETLNRFDENLYKDYLDKAFGVKFNVKKSFNKFTDLIMEFADEERDKIFELTFYVDAHKAYTQIYDSKTLGNENNKTFDIGMHSFVFIDDKKQVLTKDRFMKVSDVKIFTDPTILLPKTKISKLAKGEIRKNSKTTKRDFEALIEGKFNGEVSNLGGGQSYYYIPVHNEEYIVVIWRNTFMRLGYYNLYAIGKPLDKSKKFVFTKYQKWLEHKELVQKYPGYGSSTHFIENQKGFDFLRSALSDLNKSGNLDKFVKDYIEFSKHIYDE